MRWGKIIFINIALIWLVECSQSCPPGEVLVRKPEGWKCLRDYRNRWHSRPISTTSTTENPGHFGFGGPRYQQQQSQDPFSFGQQQSQEQFGFNGRPLVTTTPDQSISFQENEIDDGDSYYGQGGVRKRPVVDPLSYNLPAPNDRIDALKERCFGKEMIYWPRDGQCYKLLEQGPCQDNHWLVLQDDYQGNIQVTCKRNQCPCRPENPQLCEVWYENPGKMCGSGCRVALAAAQDEICPEGEQLLVSPYGNGICGCQQDNPPHIRWEADNKCYPVHTQGPCPSNHTLQYSPPMNSPICVPKVCPEPGSVLHSDGKCYDIDTRGPCDEDSIFQMDKGNLDPRCKPRVHVKRIFDLAPNHARGAGGQRNSIIGNLLRVQMSDCATSSDPARCYKQDRRKKEGGNLGSLFQRNRKAILQRAQEAKQFLIFLWSFKNH